MNGFQLKLLSLLLLGVVIFIWLLSGCVSHENKSPDPPRESDKRTSLTTTSGSRLVKHLKGVSIIPVNPKRIAVLDYRIADSLLALGIKPVATGSFIGSTDIPYMDGHPLKESINLGDAPNLEAILATEPDLIIGTDAQTIAYESLSQIAPTVIVPVAPKDWQVALQEMGQMLDRERQAIDWITRYSEKADEAKKQINGRVPSNETVMFLRVLKKEFRLYGERQLTGTLLYQDLGLKAPLQVSSIEGVNKVISMEMLPEINPDYILLDVGAIAQADDKQGEALYNDLLQSSLWKSLKAVQNNHVYRVPEWFFRTDFPISRGKSLTFVIDALINGKGTLQK